MNTMLQICVIGFIIVTLLTQIHSFKRASFRAPGLIISPKISLLLKLRAETAGTNAVNVPAEAPEENNEENVTTPLEESLDDSHNTTAIDPIAEMIKNKELDLAAQVEKLENDLRFEKSALLQKRDKISESGKNGFFIVQAQVADFLRKKDVDQKERVKRNKRDFVKKMLPVVDSFRSARTVAPPNTEREERMHDTFGSLLSSILTVFEKYGFKEFEAAVDSKYDPVRHEVKEMREGEPDGIVLEQVRQGIEDGDGLVVRRALVIVGKTAEPASEPPAQEVEQEEQKDGMESETTSNQPNSVDK